MASQRAYADGAVGAVPHSAEGAWRAERAPITPATARSLDAYWRCANYLSLGQIYLRANPLLRRPLTFDDVKPRPVGHWGTIPVSTSSTRM